MCKITTSNGTFSIEKFDIVDITSPSNSSLKLAGCKIMLKFIPNNLIGKDSERVSLVQAVNDSMIINKKKYDSKGKEIVEEIKVKELNKAANFNNRTTNNGWAIDQVLKENLDPRYAECRKDPTKPYRELSLELKGKYGYVSSAIKTMGVWNEAYLSDEPTVPYAFQNAYISGIQIFEVVAMLDGEDGIGKEYLGSIKWGWRCTKKSDKDQTIITLIMPEKESDTASNYFIDAAKKWNEINEVKTITEFKLPTE